MLEVMEPDLEEEEAHDQGEGELEHVPGEEVSSEHLVYHFCIFH